MLAWLLRRRSFAVVHSVAPVLINVVRNGHVESQHRGSLVLLDPSGAAVVTAGCVDDPVFPRSSLKPLQAVAMVTAGFPGRGASLALAAASHDGEDVHVAGARATLAAAGLDDSALQCPPELPSGPAALLDWVAAGGRPARVCHNCSGKHAAMVATCVAMGWSVGTYRDPSHPLQVVIRDAVERLSGDRVAATATDGCGAPAFAISLRALARAFGALATADGGAEALVRQAMRAHPRLIGGTGRAVSELTAEVPGLICKEGAEGVWGAALPDGRAFAAKIEDGGMRGLPPLLAAALHYWQIDGPAVRRWSAPEVRGGSAAVGTIGWASELRELLEG